MKANPLSGMGGVAGSAFSVGCPACVPAIGALLSSLGLGFAVNMSVLGPLTLVLLGIGILGLHTNAKKHGKKYYLLIGILASIAVFASRYVVEFPPAMYGGAALLLGNAVLDYRAARKCAACTVRKR